MNGIKKHDSIYGKDVEEGMKTKESGKVNWQENVEEALSEEWI